MRTDFTTERKQTETGIVRLKVGDLGFQGSATTDQVYAKAKELGLDLCPAEIGPHLRLKYQDQPYGDYFYIGMPQISGSDGDLDVFRVSHGGGGLWLDDSWAIPANEWSPGIEFVFSLCK